MSVFLRAMRLLALTVWVGGVIFFAFAVAPVAFGRLPSAHEAGLVVGGTLRVLHWMGLGAAAVYLLSAVAASAVRGDASRLRVNVALVVAMAALTAYSQFSVLPRMERDRVGAGGVVDATAEDGSASGDFNRLHHLSERMEGAVLLLGVVTVGLSAWEQRATRLS